MLPSLAAIFTIFCFFRDEFLTTVKIFLFLLFSLPLSLILGIKRGLSITKRLIFEYIKGDIDLVEFTKRYLSFKISDYISRSLGCGFLEKTAISYEIAYYNGSRKYKVKFPKSREKRQIIGAKNDKDEDITSDIFELLGPNHDFHGIKTTPSLLGLKSLYITYRNDKSIFYREDEKIQPFIF